MKSTVKYSIFKVNCCISFYEPNGINYFKDFER